MVICFIDHVSKVFIDNSLLIILKQDQLHIVGLALTRVVSQKFFFSQSKDQQLITVSFAL